MKYILWVKEKRTKKYIEGYERNTQEECKTLYEKQFNQCDYKIEKKRKGVKNYENI